MYMYIYTYVYCIYIYIQYKNTRHTWITARGPLAPSCSVAASRRFLLAEKKGSPEVIASRTLMRVRFALSESLNLCIRASASA